MIGMQLLMRQRQLLVCTTCGRSEDDHAEGCPSDAMRKLRDGSMRWVCGEIECRDIVEVTSEDFLQCRGCARRYSRGEISDTENPERVILHRVSPDEDYEQVLVLAKRGVKSRTVFVVDVTIRKLREQEIIWRQRRRKEKRSCTSKKNREEGSV